MKSKDRTKNLPIAMALIGAGPEARRIVRGYTDTGISILAVWDPEAQDAADFAKDLGAKAYESLESLLADSQVNAVEVTTPIERRASDAIEAIKTGKATSVRVPVAPSIEDARRLAETIARSGGKFRYLDPLHYHAPHALARKLAQKGEIGILNGIRIKVAARDIEPIAPDSIDEPLDRLTLAQWFLDQAAEVETMRNEFSSVSIIRFTQSHKFGNFEAVRSPQLEVPFSERPWDETIEITGSTGIIWVNGFWGPIADRPPVVMRRFKRTIGFGADITANPRSAYKRAASCFVRAIQNDELPQPGIDGAITDLKLLVAAAKSATNGGRVKVE